MSWIYLCLAIVLEVSGTTCMKLSQGFTKILPSVFIFVFYGGSFSLMPLVLKKIDISVAYAIWSGTGTALIALVGIYWFKEPATTLKIMSLGLVIMGVVGLNLSGGGH